MGGGRLLGTSPFARILLQSGGWAFTMLWAYTRYFTGIIYILDIYIYIYIYIYISIYLSLYLSIYIYLYLYLSLSIDIYIYVLYLSI